MRRHPGGGVGFVRRGTSAQPKNGALGDVRPVTDISLGLWAGTPSRGAESLSPWGVAARNKIIKKLVLRLQVSIPLQVHRPCLGRHFGF